MKLHTMHPGLPLMLRRMAERDRLRALRRAQLASLTAADGAVLFGLVVVLAIVVFLSKV